MKLGRRLEAKPWGQTGIPQLLNAVDASAKIGEIIFEPGGGGELPVLIKYLFTSERLSIQVHPNNDQARRAGYSSGKDEMWIVLDAEPGATIGLGLTREASGAELRAAVADGSIEKLVDWRPVSRGDVIYNTAGTIHAAGAGLTLLEVQQSVDCTYRLYDYGRPRELHLDEGLAVARGNRHDPARDCRIAPGESRILADGPYFGSAWCHGRLPAGLPLASRQWQVVVVEGRAQVEGRDYSAGEAATLSSPRDLNLFDDTVALIAWPVTEKLAQAA